MLLKLNLIIIQNKNSIVSEHSNMKFYAFFFLTRFSLFISNAIVRISRVASNKTKPFVLVFTRFLLIYFQDTTWSVHSTWWLKTLQSLLWLALRQCVARWALSLTSRHSRWPIHTSLSSTSNSTVLKSMFLLCLFVDGFAT